jgi:hypothetical protein
MEWNQEGGTMLMNDERISIHQKSAQEETNRRMNFACL